MTVNHQMINAARKHRARVLQKMFAESFADLVRLAEKADVHPPKI
jgi:FixJ family two-component response regulator